MNAGRHDHEFRLSTYRLAGTIRVKLLFNGITAFLPCQRA